MELVALTSTFAWSSTIAFSRLTSVLPKAWLTSYPPEHGTLPVAIMSLPFHLFLIAPILLVASTPTQSDRTLLQSVTLKDRRLHENIHRRVSYLNNIFQSFSTVLLRIGINIHILESLSFLSKPIGTPGRHWTKWKTPLGDVSLTKLAKYAHAQ